MKYFLTDSFGSAYENALIASGNKNFLYSYAYCLENYQKAFKTIDKLPKDASIILDSGAFSAWNSGKEIDRKKLLNFYRTIKDKYPNLNINYINLDVIPGKKGQKPTKLQAEQACKDSWNNFIWFKDNGINVLPVFHEDDNFEYLYKMMQQCDYICISPANDSKVDRRMIWLDKVYSILKYDYKTHGLAATSKQLLNRYPFYSVDSINWKTPTIYGRSFTDKNKTDISITSHLAKSTNRANLMEKEARKYIKLQDYFTKVWYYRGVKWNE